MAGINPNLKLQQNLQLNATPNVDTKAPQEEVGDAKPSAVWLGDVGDNNPNWEKGDIVWAPGDKLYKVRKDGTLKPLNPRNWGKCVNRNLEYDRGDFIRTWQ